MTLRTTTKFTYKNGTPRKFWGCNNFPQCKGTHGANPDGSPVGVPADKATKEARIRAHKSFDAHWEKKNLSRSEGYRLLQEIMEMSGDDAHIGKFTKEQCELLIKKISELPS